MGCDTAVPSAAPSSSDFNPHTPNGVRPHCAIKEHEGELFQSSHPKWGATEQILAGSGGNKFQSSHPKWGATKHFAGVGDFTLISILTPQMGCDYEQILAGSGGNKFQSSHLKRGATYSLF